MPKTHLPAHMDSVRQKCRPKHQLLILKCYPRLPKNSAADVKPNGSELSYLLYYASTRRSKLQKVGAFLEKKTASDVYKFQSARVLVTLQIVTALVENKVVGEGSSLVLIAPYVMRLISGILQNTNDISLIEASQKTWDVFCQHQDQGILAADHEYRELYEHVVEQYAAFAYKTSSKKIGKSTTPVAVQDAIRLRQIGLLAIKSVLVSDALAFESGRHVLSIAVPAILSNLRGDDAAYLSHIVRLSQENDEEEKDKVMNRRQSMATVRTYTGTTTASIEVEADPRAAEGTAQDADELAEEEVAHVALDSLKAVFNTENRAQVRSATSAVLSYLSDLQYYQRPQTATSEKPAVEPAKDSWSIKIFELCTTWTPVQDRFVLMVTAVETLAHMPLKDPDMRQHFLFAYLIDNILRSDLNLIGLSIMDILLGLIQQILRILQLGGASVSGSPQRVSTSEKPEAASSANISPQTRLLLVDSLKACIADLATHVYYTDQISDMIAAILLRLKPNPAPSGQQNPMATALAIEEPKLAVNEVASNSSLPPRERSNSSSGFFSFDTARQVALEVVRDILKVANSTRSQYSSGIAESRNAVHISIWEGTQWLLRDPCAEVRKAYAEALITWLELETKKTDFRLSEPKQNRKKQKQQDGAANGALARRAVSNASATKDRTQSKKQTTTFLQLLHLANYENALQFAATSPEDILIVSTLLTTLIKRLGVNAAASGLPMIFALQEEIARVESPVGKVRIGSLVHGYLWALVEVFDFEADGAGRAVLAEVARRQGKSLWVREIQYPPLSLETISERSLSGSTNLTADTVAHEDLKPFDNRAALVEAILDHYSASVASPPPSAPGSPGRGFSLGSLDRTASSYLSAKQMQDPSRLNKAREAMMANWSRDDCLASIAAMAPKSVSLSGSQTSPNNAFAAATAGNHRQLLAAANNPPTRNGGTPPTKQSQQLSRQGAIGQLNNARLHSQSPDRRPSGSSNGRNASSSAAARGPLRVEELKRVLANGVFTSLAGGPRRSGAHDYDAGNDTASDSVVEVDEGMEFGSDDGVYVTPPQSKKGVKGVKMDVGKLLESIEIGEDEKRGLGMGRPPY